MPIDLTDEQRETLRRCLCECIAGLSRQLLANTVPDVWERTLAAWPDGWEQTIAAWLENGGDGEAIIPGSYRGWRHDLYHLAEMLGEWPLNYHGCEGWRPITLAPAEECLALRDPTVTPTDSSGQ